MHILNWKLGLARYNQAKHLKPRWPWIVSVDPTANDKGAYLRHTGAGHATDARTGVMWPQAKDTWSPLEAARGRKDPPLSVWGRDHGPVNILTSDSWPLELRENKSTILSPSVVLCYGRPPETHTEPKAACTCCIFASLFRLYHVACRILLPRPGSNPGFLHWGPRVLSTRQPGKTPAVFSPKKPGSSRAGVGLWGC